MKHIHLIKRLIPTSLVLGLLALPSIGFTTPALAHTTSSSVSINSAQDYQSNPRYDDWYDDDRYSNQSRYSRSEIKQRALAQGYIAGFRQGREDDNNGERASFWRDQNFREATLGFQYSSRFRSYYQDSFRQAFRIGYADGYNGRSFNRSYVRDQNQYNDRSNGYDYNRDFNYNDDYYRRSR